MSYKDRSYVNGNTHEQYQPTLESGVRGLMKSRQNHPYDHSLHGDVEGHITEKEVAECCAVLGIEYISPENRTQEWPSFKRIQERARQMRLYGKILPGWE